MANWFARVFAPSPFRPLIEHQRKVLECVSYVPKAVEASIEGDHDQLIEHAKTLSTLEYEADVVKTQVRDQLPGTIFMPVSRADLLRVVSAQDSIADSAEDVGVLLTMRPLSRPPDEVVACLRQHVQAVVQVVVRATAVVDQLDTLVRTSFSGPEAERVLAMIDQVDREEHESDKIQDQLAKVFFRHEEHFKPAEIYLWMRIFETIAEIANHAEKMTHRVRLFLAN